MTIGLANIFGICGKFSYSICEEIGGFYNADVVVHELGHV
jgi:ribosomal protein S13